MHIYHFPQVTNTAVAADHTRAPAAYAGLAGDVFAPDFDAELESSMDPEALGPGVFASLPKDGLGDAQLFKPSLGPSWSTVASTRLFLQALGYSKNPVRKNSSDLTTPNVGDILLHIRASLYKASHKVA